MLFLGVKKKKNTVRFNKVIGHQVWVKDASYDREYNVEK